MSVLQKVIEAGNVIPVLAYNSVDEAVETSHLLYECGLRVFEITLRHPTALEAVRAVIKSLPEDAYTGVGTIMNPSLLKASIETGASFGVSPGLTPSLRQAILDSKWAFLPGVATLSEAMTAYEAGFSLLKFFPAAHMGGTGFLKSAGAVLPDVEFCPTGGIHPGIAQNYLMLKNVPVVGGSWVVERDSDGQVDREKTRANAEALKNIA